MKAVEGRGSLGESKQRGADAALHVCLGVRGSRGKR